MTTIEFNKKLTCGPEFVAVEIKENCEELKVGNIWLTSNASANDRLAFAKITSVGTVAAEKYSLSVGDYVMIDRLATFAHTAPVAALKYDSVICKSNETNTEYFPLRNMMFVEPDNRDTVTKIGNIYVDKYEDRLKTGTIIKMNCDSDLNLPFKVNDKVLLSKGGDHIQVGEQDFVIYKYDMIVATIED